MFETMRNRFVSFPRPSTSGKYFWFCFIVSIRHSCGTSRNAFSKCASYTAGNSTSAVTSS